MYGYYLIFSRFSVKVKFLISYDVGFLTELLVLLCIPFYELIILDDQSALYIKQIIAKFESNPGDQRFDHLILPSVSMPTMSLLFFWSPVLRYQLATACPIHDRKLRCSS